jgi:hypothetical protein
MNDAISPQQRSALAHAHRSGCAVFRGQRGRQLGFTSVMAGRIDPPDASAFVV